MIDPLHLERATVRLVVAFAVLLATPRLEAPSADDPRAVVRAATRAVEGDSAEHVRARLAARVARDANDRAALLGLATLSRLSYGYPAADAAYRRLFAGPADRYAAYARLGLAEGLDARGYARDAQVELARARFAAQAVGDRVAEGEALLWLAFIRGRIEGVKVAEALIDSTARCLPDSVFDLQARLWIRRAIVHALRGRASEARAAAESSIALARRAGDPRAEADGLRTLGQVLQYRGQWDSAFTALQRSEQRYIEARYRSGLAGSYIWHAQVLGSRGRYGAMREVMQRALVESEATHNEAAKASAHRAFGVLALMLGDGPAAAAHFNRSMATSRAIGDSSGAFSTNKYLVKVALIAGDVATARRLLEARLALARQQQDLVEQYESLTTLAGVAQRERDWTTASRLLAEARSTLQQLPGTNYRTWLVEYEAHLALAQGDWPAGIRLLQRVLSDRTGSSEPARFDARVRLADAYARRGDLDRAQREIETATDDIDRWRATLDDAELRTLAFQAAASVDAAAFEPDANQRRAANIVAAMVSAGRAAAAFDIAERWRARELADRLARGAALRVGESAGMGGRATSGAPAMRAADVAAALPDDRVALLEFVAAEGAPVTLFVVQRRGVEARVLSGLDSLDASVVRFSTLLEGGAGAEKLGRTLGQTLLDPVLPLLDPRVTRLIVIPDGPLHRLPFDALRLAGGHYVLERYALGVSPSAATVAALWRRPARPVAQETRLLALGDPATAATPDVDPQGGTPDREGFTVRVAGGFPPLNGAAREARLVSSYAPASDVRLGADASAAFLKRADLSRYRVLHFAAHAIVDEQSIAGTSLVLAPGSGESGYVGAGDLAALRLDADLVVLSACRSAGGMLVGGEGVQGFTSPLLQAGARAVVATAWRLGDESAVPFVDALYAALARGLPVADALREAKLGALRNGASPRLWASFVAIGDPFALVPLRAPSTLARWWANLVR